MHYSALFDGVTLRSGLTLRNRITVAPMTTWSSNEDGTVHEDELAYIQRRANGPGMFMTAACYVHPLGHAFEGQWSAANDDMLPSLQAVAEVIRKQNARAILQIHHGGRMCPSELIGMQPVSASAEPAERPGADVPRPMTEKEIYDTIQDFAEATRRAIAAGFDGVEIHGANTYLLQQFFSPHSNRRGDDWGGSLEKRMRFPLAVTDAVMQVASEAPRPFAVGYRISPEEIEDPGITIEDTLQLAAALADRLLDWLHVSVRSYRAGSMRDSGDSTPTTRRIIKHLNGQLPVIGVGLIHTPEDAISILDDGCVAVALGRIALMEPEWVQKVVEGQTADIRTTLPMTDGDTQLTIPTPMYNILLSRIGWLPVE
jgi:2,4-dienoyl-CoA reductase-like NADH-dependent reductase (Old Yellow Enzyme family)